MTSAVRDINTAFSSMVDAHELDMEFGIPRLPTKVDPWEEGEIPSSRCRLDRDVARALAELESSVQSALLRPAAQTKNFIWAMAGDGEIVIAIEEIAPKAYNDSPRVPNGYPRRKGLDHPVEKKKLGHPTLLDGGHARIAGEIAFDRNPKDGRLVWMLNANSGRYCAENPPSARQVDNVAERFVKLGLTVTVDYMDAE
ncbi:hypothetical protein [Pinisolibacter sp.]|uniref:hypothetical protein n=1 Tax=Pinisolibacter sp. TaxID=2172024 RepID=UPI002FDE090B